MPPWLVAPVLTLAIPDSPFGFGHRLPDAAPDAPSPTPASPTPVSAEPETVGFIELEGPSPTPAPTDLDTKTPTAPAAEAVPGAIAPDTAPPAEAEAEADEAKAAAPALPAEVEASKPGVTDASPAPVVAAPAAEPVETPPAIAVAVPEEGSGKAVAAEKTGETEEAAEMEAAGTEKPTAAESLAAALRRGVVEEAPSPDERHGVDAATRPLPRSPGEARPSARELRAEPAQRPSDQRPPAPRPPSAPQAASDADALVAPDALEPAPGDVAVPQRPGERPTMRNRRLYRRVGMEAELEIDGAAATLVDLSMAGFAATNAPEIAADTVVPVALRMSIDGVDISTRMRARMVYTNEPRSGGRFVDLTASQTAFLRYLVTWRGQAVGAIGTTSLLEAIARTPERALPPPEPHPPEPGNRPVPWWSRWFGWLRARGAASP